MNFKIPDTIRIISTDWGISYDQMVLDGANAVGLNVPENKMIYINDSAPNVPEIFIHETVHAILDALGREDLNEDETFIKPFSKCLHQVIQQLGNEK